MSVTVRAPAKINLQLGVGAARDDGFHPLDTVYQAISLYDDVTVSDAAAWTVEVDPVGDVDVEDVPLDESNIAIRAGRLLTEHHGVTRRARISIGKGIPVAGGMAGGSADAAATLVALDRLWDLQTTDEDLLAIAAELGSDVPFALIGGTAHGTGRGEVVEPVADAGTWWWVVVPNADGLSTPRVYKQFDVLKAQPRGSEATDRKTSADPCPPSSDVLRAALGAGDLDGLAGALLNDLEEPALSLRPDLRATADQLLDAGVMAVLLSGSGPTYLGLAANQHEALGIRDTLGSAGVRALVATGAVAGTHVVEYA